MDQPFSLAPGTLLGGNFQIIKRIGQGGMGAVYMAYDIHLELQVAIKIISPEFYRNMEARESECVRKRFASEAKVAAKIDHPNVIRIFGFRRETIPVNGRDCDIDYLVMELLAGRTLRNTMDVSGFEHEAEIIGWIETYMLPMLDGLAKVHDCGIIHRDIKPENFLMKDDAPKLADFGLSLGFDFPAVTGSVADIYGTVTYMAPEQFYNFSMAREAADIYAMGKVLYEAVEGKISEKAKPFRQVKLSDPATGFLQHLDEIIKDATAESPNQRIGSAREFRNRLNELLYCKSGHAERRALRGMPNPRKVFILSLAFAIALGLGALAMHLPFPEEPAAPVTETAPSAPESAETVTTTSFPKGIEKLARAGDNSILHLIPAAVIELPEGNPLKREKVAIKPFYLSESPVTNQQYVAFLNKNLARIMVEESDVLLGGKLVLKLSEKIRGYKPIEFNGERFVITDPMHSACAVLLVTGFGAEAYARFHGLRLPRPKEWFYALLTDDAQAETGLKLPTPVLNYEQNALGLRGINRLAEWGRTETGGFAVLGQSPSRMIESEPVLAKDPEKYYTDTGFRLARDAR